jgi:uncharacterized protein Usg
VVRVIKEIIATNVTHNIFIPIHIRLHKPPRLLQALRFIDKRRADKLPVLRIRILRFWRQKATGSLWMLDVSVRWDENEHTMAD